MMQSTTYLNHMNFAVPPEDLAALDACIEAVLPWRRYVKRDDLIGYRIGDGEDSGGVFIRPVEACGEIAAVMKRVRRSVPDLDRALVSLERSPADFADHVGFRVSSVDEWERLLTGFEEAARSHPEWRLTVVDVHRPGDAGALTDRIYQAWLRIGLLGPIRNTFEMQCENPDAAPRT